MKQNQIHHRSEPELLPEIKERDQWMCWYSKQEENGKFRKKPYPHDDTCILYEPGVARYKEEENWLSYTEAREIQKSSVKPLGLGFVLTELDDFVALDLDYCVDRETLVIEKKALNIVKKSQSYAEISPSGTGIHILLKGDIPRQGWTNQLKNFRLEVYDRFFITVTEKYIPGTYKKINTNQGMLDEIFNNYSITWPDPKFTSFWPEKPP